MYRVADAPQPEFCAKVYVIEYINVCYVLTCTVWLILCPFTDETQQWLENSISLLHRS
jgi:hypothetical protein